MTYSTVCRLWCNASSGDRPLADIAAIARSPKNFAREHKYFTTGQQQGRLNYEKVAAIKLPIGSGAIESLIRQVVNCRLKGTGKFWLLEHAEIMLHALRPMGGGNMGNFL